jgi:hypothetical protein
MTAAMNRRRIVLIDKSFQVGMALRIVVYLAGYFVFFFMMAALAPLLGTVLGGASHAETTVALDDFLAFSSRLLSPLALTFICLALHTILLSHRVAGPAYHVQRIMQQVSDGNLAQTIHLRKGDYLTEVENTCNASIERFRADVESLKAEANALVAGGADGGEGAGRMLEILDTYHTGAALEAPEPVAEAEAEVEVTEDPVTTAE